MQRAIIDKISGIAWWHDMAAASIFKDVPGVPTDHVFCVNQMYKDDQNPNKVNMGIGGKSYFKNQTRHMSRY